MSADAVLEEPFKPQMLARNERAFLVMSSDEPVLRKKTS
jgi:hypothetical protein